MRHVNNYAFNAQANTAGAKNSDPLNANQWVACSFMGYFTDAAAAGALKLQFSNDIGNTNINSTTFTPTNWVDVPGTTATATVASGAACVLYVPVNFVARYYRVVWTRSGGAGTFSVTYEALTA
jgi:hypothetical protein